MNHWMPPHPPQNCRGRATFVSYFFSDVYVASVPNKCHQRKKVRFPILTIYFANKKIKPGGNRTNGAV